jgi:site-specific DNA recombinase
MATLHYMLTNPIYIGKVRCKGKVFTGEHAAIVDDEVFAQVQRLLARNKRCGGEVRNRSGAMLSHLLWCKACGTPMIHSYSEKPNQRRYHYYVCSHAQKRGWDKCPHPSIPANEIEAFVVDEIRAMGRDEEIARQVVEDSRAIRAGEIDEKDRQHRLLRQELARRQRELQAAVARTDAPATPVRLAALQEQIDAAALEVEVAGDELEVLRNSVLTEDDIVQACRSFSPVWDTLTSKEQWRLLMLVIARVEFDAGAGTISITFHPNGIKALNQETAAKEAATA